MESIPIIIIIIIISDCVSHRFICFVAAYKILLININKQKILWTETLRETEKERGRDIRLMSRALEGNISGWRKKAETLRCGTREVVFVDDVADDLLL